LLDQAHAPYLVADSSVVHPERRLMTIPALGVVVALVLGACAGSVPGASGDSLTDASIIAFARKPYDKAAMMNRSVPVGRHHGATVVADFPCSDLCPNYTTRIIHYQLGGDQTCADVGGVIVDRSVPVSIAVSMEKFCVPKALEAAHLQ
jgi:hypothetical protein